MAKWIHSNPTNGEPPRARGFHACTNIEDDRFIIFGGCTHKSEKDELEYLNDTWIFDKTGPKWNLIETRGTIPSPRAQATLSLIYGAKKVLLFGGSNGKEFFNETYVLDLVSFIWSKVELKGAIPTPRAGHCAVSIQGSTATTIVIFGGRADTFSNELFSFTVSPAAEISEIQFFKIGSQGDIPNPMAFHSATLIGQDIYVFGGYVYYQMMNAGDCFNTLYKLETNTMKWSILSNASLPSPRYGHCAFEFKDKLFIFGGLTKHDEFADNSLFYYNIKDKKWNKYDIQPAILNAPLTQKYSHSAIPLQPKIYIFGGLRPELFSSNNKHEIRKVYSTDLITFYKLENIDSPNLSSSSLQELPKIPRKEKPKEKEKEKDKKKASKKPPKLDVGNPFGLKHNVHVDFDFKWEGQNPYDVFVLGERLGEGSFGSVYKGFHKGSHFLLAIKEIAITKEKLSEDIKTEIEVLKKCKHKNIVSYFGTCLFDGKIWILMDFCEHGSVRDLMELCEATFNEEEISFIVSQTLYGLMHLHKLNIIHRDVKAGNILLTTEGQIKLADFGVSATIGEGYDTIGTPLWMAPEVILRTSYDTKCDIWSLAITVIEMADGYPPYSDLNLLRAMHMIPMRPSPTVQDKSQFSYDFNDFLSKALIKDPKRRPSAAELIMHTFVQKPTTPEVLKERIKIAVKKRKEPKVNNAQNNSSSSGYSPNDNTVEQTDSPQRTKVNTGGISSTGGEEEGNFSTLKIKSTPKASLKTKKFPTYKGQTMIEHGTLSSSSAVTRVNTAEVQNMIQAAVKDAILQQTEKFEQAVNNLKIELTAQMEQLLKQNNVNSPQQEPNRHRSSQDSNQINKEGKLEALEEMKDLKNFVSTRLDNLDLETLIKITALIRVADTKRF